MKKFSILSLIIISIILWSCSKDLDKNTSAANDSREYFLGFDDRSTKTSVDEDGTVSWCEGDEIMYLTERMDTEQWGAYNKLYRTNVYMRDSNPCITIDHVGSQFVAVYGGDSLTYKNNNYWLYGAVKAEQSGRFEDAHVAVVKPRDLYQETLEFTNLTSLVRFTLDRDDVSYIVFSSNNGIGLYSNAVKITFPDAGPIATLSSTTDSSIKVNIDGSGTYYISTLACSLTNGFSIKLYGSDDTIIGSIYTDHTLNIPSNGIVDLGTLNPRDSYTTPMDSANDLSAGETANCYIVGNNGFYKFKAVKGNTNTSVGSIASVEVLWESYGTNVKPFIGSLVNNIRHADGYIAFKTSNRRGNAVIAARDASGKILWSWHIWHPVTTPVNQVYQNEAGSMMDMNLGAIDNTAGSVYSLGLLYQWGRKDPFLNADRISPDSNGNLKMAASTITWPAIEKSRGGVTFAIENPTTFTTKYAVENPPDNTRWQTSDKTKGLYDPCPPGYRVPDREIWVRATYSTFAANAFQTTFWSDSSKGMNLSAFNSNTSRNIWYPAAGYIRFDTSDGQLGYVGLEGNYWSCSSAGDPGVSPQGSGVNNQGYYAPETSVSHLSLRFDGFLYACQVFGNRNSAYSVRCAVDTHR